MNRASTITFLILSILCFVYSPGRTANVNDLAVYHSMPVPGPVFTFHSNYSGSLFVDDNYTPSEPGYGITHFSSIGDALVAAAPGDVINIHDGIYPEALTVSMTVTLTAMPGEFPELDGTSLPGSTAIMVNGTNVAIEGLTIKNYDFGIVISATGSAEIAECKIFDNIQYGVLSQNTTATSTAVNCWWGAPSGPSDLSDDRSTGGLYNPDGQGNMASDYINYYPWSVNQSFTQSPVEFGIYNPSCEVLEVRLKPLSDINSTTTMLLFTVRWPGGPDALENISSPVFNVELVNLVTNVNGYNYAIFGSDDFTPVNYTAGTEIPVLTFEHDGTGTGFGDFEIVLDAWTVSNDANPYLELMGTDYSGTIYHFAENVYLDECDNAELQVRALLEGPYDSLSNLMNTTINTDIPLNQPYYYPPWVYTGNENLASVPTNMVDWVLVELRETPGGPAVDRSAGLLMNDGSILDASLDGSIRFNGIVPSSAYYIVIHHRNHLPVMSLNPLVVPNMGLFDFADTLNFPPYGTGKKALIRLENGVYGLISGDINNDGIIKYSGPANDRGLIMNMIYYVTGSPVITQTIEGYYKEDLTMDRLVKYSGPNNDQREIILNLVELTGSTALNSIYQCVVPGYSASAPVGHGQDLAYGMTSEFADIGIFEYDNPDELVIKIRPDHNIPGYGLTNIQFTLRWPETSNVYQLWPTANSINSTFNIQPQGQVSLESGFYHQTFAAANNTLLNWSSGVEYPVLVLKYFYTSGDCTEFEITNDSWTIEHNGTYYFEVIGQNRTGIMYAPLLQIVSEGGFVAGSQEICLGTSTGIMVLADYTGNVIKWQKRFNDGVWTDIPGTSGITSYSEVPEFSGNYSYRAEVQNFGCTPDFSEPAIIGVAGEAIWTGNSSSTWDDVSNWNVCGIPTLQKNVIIPDVTPKPFPYVNVNAYCKTLLIQTGATVTVSLTGSITVGDNTP